MNNNVNNMNFNGSNNMNNNMDFNRGNNMNNNINFNEGNNMNYTPQNFNNQRELSPSQRERSMIRRNDQMSNFLTDRQNANEIDMYMKNQNRKRK